MDEGDQETGEIKGHPLRVLESAASQSSGGDIAEVESQPEVDEPSERIRRFHALHFYDFQIFPKLLNSEEITPEQVRELYRAYHETYYQGRALTSEEFTLLDVYQGLWWQEGVRLAANPGYANSKLFQIQKRGIALLEATCRPEATRPHT